MLGGQAAPNKLQPEGSQEPLQMESSSTEGKHCHTLFYVNYNIVIIVSY